MNSGIYDNIKTIIAYEWFLLLLGFLLLLFNKQFFIVFDNLYHLVSYLLVSLSAVTAFLMEALFLFVGHIGMQGGFYLSDFYTNHLLHWFLFVFLFDFVCYIVTTIMYILKTDFIFGRRSNSGARMDIYPYESKDLIISRRRVVLLQ